MDLVTGVMDSLIPKLLKMLGDEYKLQTGMKKKVQFLIRELESIHAFLRKVSDVPWDQLDEQVKVWAREAREASYDTEDIIDSFVVQVEGRAPNDNPSRLKRALKKMANLFSEGKARHDVGSAIEDIKRRLEEVADRRARYRIDDIVVNPAAATKPTVDPRLHAMYKEVTNLVGISKPSDDLISMLSFQAVDMASRKKVVAIVGIGGLGKTTLAKAVYDKIKVDFECWAFVSVGRNPNLSKLLMDILYELDKKRFEDIHTKNRDERQLIDILREFLIDKRYFIVIDDIWEDKSWKETIELALLENNCGSRIIITTRNSEVAKEIGDEIYRMQPLSDDSSKTLFYSRIFGANKKWPDNEGDDISNKILKKCDGVPLAITTMASLLVGKPRERWSDVFNSVRFYQKDDKVDITKKILSFSYYDMPCYLRTCLLYLSIFPEDDMINKESLIWMWIAEGFIQAKPGIRLFEVGEQYLIDLINRSMVEAIELQFDGMFHACRIHDMVLDLIRSISSEENFVTILDNNDGTVSPSPCIARRLALHVNATDNIADGNTVIMAQVRSFAAIRCSLGNWVPLSSFKLLRVLELEGCNSVKTSHLVHLRDLLHLRYLGLRNCIQIDDLPNEIGDLMFLMILNLEFTSIRQLTPSISRLTQLVCLKGVFHQTMAPSWISKLTSLEELKIEINYSNSSEEEESRGFFKALGSLRELRVFESRVSKMDKSMQRDLVLSLRNLHKLQILRLYKNGIRSRVTADNALWGEENFVFLRHLRVLHLDFLVFSSLPRCIGAACLPNLTDLWLCLDDMDEKDLEFLGRLPELHCLVLRTNSTATLSNISASNGCYFMKLRACYMPMTMFQLQRRDEDSSATRMSFGLAPYAAMPNLEVLFIKISVRSLHDSLIECGKTIGFEFPLTLRDLDVQIDSKGASDAEVQGVKSALREATWSHPYTRLSISSCPEGGDISVEEEDQKQQEGQPTVDN